MPLEGLISLGEDVRDRTRTLAAAVAPGISPLTGEPMFGLPDDEVFIGMGVHGEPGMGRREAGPARDLVRHMVDVIVQDRPIPAGTPTVVLVNGAGGTTLMELLIVYREVAAVLDASGVPTFLLSSGRSSRPRRWAASRYRCSRPRARC